MGYSTPHPNGMSDPVDVIRHGLYLVDVSGVLRLLDPEAIATGDPAQALDSPVPIPRTTDVIKARRGRPQSNARLSVRAFLVITFALTCMGRILSWPAMTRLIFLELSDESLRLLGLTEPYWKSRLDSTEEFGRVTRHLGDTCTEMLAAMDLTTLAANKKHPLTDLLAAQEADPGWAQRTAVRDEVVHRLLRASLLLGNRIHYGDEVLREGIFKHWQGHLGMDETKAVVSTGMHLGRIAPAVQIARQSGHDRHHRHPDSIGLHGLVAVSGHSRYTVPAVCVGLSITNPGAAVTEPVLSSLDMIESVDPDLVPRPRLKGSGTSGATHRYIVGDRAYPQGIGLNAGLIQRNFSMVGLPSSDQRPYERLAEHGSAATEGPLLSCHGTVMCPGVNKKRLEASRSWSHPGPDATIAKTTAHANTEAYLAAFAMGTKWRLPQLKNALPGRPKTGSTPRQQWKLQVACPASEGRVLCPLVRPDDATRRDLIARGVPEVEEQDLPKVKCFPSAVRARPASSSLTRPARTRG